MTMTRKIVIGLGIILVTVLPVTVWAGKSADKHDCRAEKGGKYVCEKGPLAGKTFASKKAMIDAMRNGSPSSDQTQPVSAKPVKAKVSKKSSR
jgi:hypothetical protein